MAGEASYVNNYLSAAVQNKIAGEGTALIIVGCYPDLIKANKPSTGLLVLVEEGT